MEWAVCTASSDSEDAMSQEAEEEGAHSSTSQQGSLSDLAQESSTSFAHGSMDLALVNKAASTSNSWNSVDSVKAEAGERPPAKVIQDPIHVEKKGGNKVPVHHGACSILTVNVSEETGSSYSGSKDITMQMSEDEQELVTEEDLGETAEKLEFHNSTSVLVKKMKVLIIGDSWVVRLMRYCHQHHIEEDLGCPGVQVEWHGRGGLQWAGAMAQLEHLAKSKHPEVIVVHCGGNDMGTVKGISLLQEMKEGCENIMKMFASSTLVYSEICQQLEWPNGQIPGSKLEKTRRRINKEVAALLRDHGMPSVYHANISFRCPELFLHDGVHLSPQGNTIFLGNFQRHFTQ